MAEKDTTAGDQEASSAAAPAIEAPKEPRYLLPPPTNSEALTVFLDLDGTLIHASEEQPENFDFVITTEMDGNPFTYYIQKRPFVDELLDYLRERSFEVVLFTAGMKEYASSIVDLLDTKKVISHSLYRDSCTTRDDGDCVKDLSLTGRDLGQVLIVDDRRQSFSLQPENGLNVWSFEGNLKDEDLRKLIKFFEESRDYVDIREAIMDFAPFGWRKIDWALHSPSPPSSDYASASGTSPPTTPRGDASPSGSS